MTQLTLDGDRRRTTRIALAVALLPFAWLVARWAFVCDDAFISFRYARHLVEGQGLRFNPGEAPAVEGYSNFLWVLWLAPFEALGVDLVAVANATSIACGAALVALVVSYAVRRLELGPLSASATALFVATLPPLSVWCTGGLETMPFALTLFASFAAMSSGSGVRAGVFALLAALLRADGALFAGGALLAGACELLAGRGRVVRALTTALLIVGAGCAAHFLWRHAYYGEWLPNTARVKTGASELRFERGAKYLATMAISALGLPLGLALGVVAFARGRRVLVAACASCALLIASYSVFVGGDFMSMGRFLVPATPFVALLFAGACARWQTRTIGRSAIGAATAFALLAALMPAFGALLVPWSWLHATHFRWNTPKVQSEREHWRAMSANAAQWRALGRGVAVHTQPGESMILGNIGAIGYESEIVVCDLFGLVDREVAAREVEPRELSPGHDKMVRPRFFFRRQPTYYETVFVRPDTPPAEGLPLELVKLLERGALIVEDRAPVADSGVDPELVQRFFRFDWSKAGAQWNDSDD